MPLRIVHVVSSLEVGGMEQFVLRLAARQRRSGHAATVLALRDGPLRSTARDLGLPAHVLGGRQKHLRVARGLACFARLRPQVIHAHNPTALHYARLGKRLTRAPVVMTYHGIGAAHAREPSQAEWDQTDAVVAVSAGAVPQLQRPELAGRLQVILNGIELPGELRDRRTMRHELGLPAAAVVGVMVARMDGLKGHATLLEALAQRQERGEAPLVLLAGDGAVRQDLEAQARRLGLDDHHVRFLGFRRDVPDLLAASDFFLLPSLTEGLPLSVLEAMAFGLPVVATPVGGIPEVVTPDREGLLIPVEDVHALAAAIARLTCNPSLRLQLGRAARERVQRDFSYDAMTSQYEELYTTLLR